LNDVDYGFKCAFPKLMTDVEQVVNLPVSRSQTPFVVVIATGCISGAGRGPHDFPSGLFIFRPGRNPTRPRLVASLMSLGGSQPRGDLGLTIGTDRLSMFVGAGPIPPLPCCPRTMMSTVYSWRWTGVRFSELPARRITSGVVPNVVGLTGPEAALRLEDASLPSGLQLRSIDLNNASNSYQPRIVKQVPKAGMVLYSPFPTAIEVW